jgi:hypothetical protein
MGTARVWSLAADIGKGPIQVQNRIRQELAWADAWVDCMLCFLLTEWSVMYACDIDHELQNYESICHRRPSILDDMSWMPVLQDLSSGHLTDLNQKYILLGPLGAKVVRIISEVDNAMSNRNTVTHEEIDGLEHRCCTVRLDLARYCIDCEPYMYASTLPQERPAVQGDIRAELLSACYALLAGACRCVGAVSPSQRMLMEEEALSLAYRLRKIRDTTKLDKLTRFYLEQRMGFSEAVIFTTDVWSQGTHELGSEAVNHNRKCSPSERLVEDYKYQVWLSYMPGNHGKYCPR